MRKLVYIMPSDRLVGRVKWFNSKSGFGFITVCDGEHKDKDIFAHYSSLHGESTQYKYLVQGEYVELDLTKSTSEQHEFHAVGITGIKGGLLMCDTHRLNSANRRDDADLPPRTKFNDASTKPRPRVNKSPRT